MNKQEYDILSVLISERFTNQRRLAEESGHSLGIVNRSVKNLIKEGYLDENIQPTLKAIEEGKRKAPKNAMILAAGFGMRMVPINTETPKALLEVQGQCLIERLIGQLREAGISKIYVVVGFMKEQFEYLIDRYDVELVVNPEYAVKNNLHSLKQVLKYLSNSYIVPCDLWCETNPFRKNEFYSWYMVSDALDKDSDVRVNRKAELVRVSGETEGNQMVGISYLVEENAKAVRERIAGMCKEGRYEQCFWEEALYEREKMVIPARVISSSKVIEINTYEQLRELDRGSLHLKSGVINLIAAELGVESEEIQEIAVLKKGMTNRSFCFQCQGKKYIMRIPGEGTDQLINRQWEADVYQAISGKGLCDDPLYINAANGYKLTAYLEGIRVCDPDQEEDIRKCMKKLREFHQMKLKVGHEFDIFGQIEFYEKLWEGAASAYRDYEKTKENIFRLRPWIEKYREEKVLTHIDAVPDNFLFCDRGNGEELQLTDWEYAGMQDPHVDIAMFCIYSLYDREQADQLISIYFEGDCPEMVRIKIYGYIAACGLLWSNWCEYKRSLGVEFGEYSLRQYRYAKDYYRIVWEELERKGERIECIQ